jgi:hypothetical protein
MGFKGDWKTEFLKTIGDPDVEINFSLDDFEGSVYKNIPDPLRGNSNWEMHNLYYNKASFERTIFHLLGETFTGEEVCKIKLY